ncbi:unnamed protein product (macronuclear) [Paramecium tetraurelia]|uniref:Fibronectin type-III domain-containing protein n=1 Tax=Paramecium tetraurelia TaxID=5888 RepID=A0C194_PARTE|nr:uncharacterized protein GSPATT00034037001 [Paramecium tetraurelia]CAK64561.1 unnamed protein product [Paramecium tetraurelia]|eukprot:XP_001431959.1 hypothetical protein (macronuclear) [Paramecium tetraurelia strain d4-2]
MLCEHKGAQSFCTCCQQVICELCICCKDSKKINVPNIDLNVLCSRCDQTSAQIRCEQCMFQFCQECFQSVHKIGKFSTHNKIEINQNLHQQILKQMSIITELEQYSQEQITSVLRYFEQIQEVLDRKKKQFLDTISNYRCQQMKILKQRISIIEAAVKINSERSFEIPECMNYQMETFHLTAKEQIIELILNIDVQKILDQSTLSPRRIHTQFSVKRSASCKKLETQEKIVEVCETFEKRKFVKQLCQSNSIQLNWTHSKQKVEYNLEMGIGMKIKGIEQFKQIYQGTEPQFIINGLQAKTNYKFRVQSTFENKTSEFSEILNLTTPQYQSVEDSLIISKKTINNDIQVLFEKPGLVLGTNPLYFGVWSWEIKLIINGIIEDLTASLVVGVANKQRKIVGTTLNYGYQRESLIIKVLVDMDNKCMTITSKMHPNGERFQNLIGPVFPAFQNKNTHKGSGQLRKLNSYVDKEVLNLTGGLYPFALFSQTKPLNHQKWVQEEIVLTNENIQKVKAWVPEQERGLMFKGEKVNQDPEYLEFKEEEISIDNDWSFEETQYLFNQLRNYNYNFIVLSDRYSYQNKNRDIYELKDRYYSVVNEVLQKRNDKSHFLYNYVYDEEYDRFRNMELEKYLKRTKQICDEDKKLQEDLRKVDQQIKKQEREHKSLCKSINLQEYDDIDDKSINYMIDMSQRNEEVKKTTTERIVYLRNKWINEALPLPSSIKDKLDRQLKEVLQNTKLALNQEIEELFCNLRKLQLGVLSQQRLQKRREQDKRYLEDKIKKLKAQHDQQQASDMKTKK